MPLPGGEWRRCTVGHEPPLRAGGGSRAAAVTIGPVERVTGIGGVFFRAGDPQALTRWYAEHLGVSPPPASYDERVWEQEAGPTVFAPFPSDSDYFRRSDQQWAVNFRVRDLDAMVDQLRRAGIAVEEHETSYPNGRFAELTDPEGTPIQLWEPADPHRT
jgi:glyoxylase I family protein